MKGNNLYMLTDFETLYDRLVNKEDKLALVGFGYESCEA